MKNLFPLILLAFLFLYSCDNGADEDRVCCTLASRCDMVPDAGPCKAMIIKYYYDKTDGKCKEFTWGGCEGVVPFNSMEECQQCEQKAARK